MSGHFYLKLNLQVLLKNGTLIFLQLNNNISLSFNLYFTDDIEDIVIILLVLNVIQIFIQENDANTAIVEGHVLK